jgi:hypothetical protein
MGLSIILSNSCSYTYALGISNDILSFYKEELAHETSNYVHLLAQMGGGQDPMRVLQDLVNDTVDLSCEIDGMLEGPAKRRWEQWKTGYITWHLELGRYRLSDLHLTE